MRIVFAGGGTGGHVLPTLAVADELRSRVSGLEAVFVGSRSGFEAKLVPQAGYPIRFIAARGVRGKGLLAKLRNAPCMGVGFVQSLGIVGRLRPDVVFGSGGYASAATVLAAACLGRPVVLQEQNSIPGTANRALGRCARRIYLGFEKARPFFGDRDGVIVTGNPIRRGIAGGRDAAARAAFGLSADRPVLLVFGGSQGARALNRAAVEYLAERRGLQAIVQTGDRDLAWVRERLAGEERRCFIAPYIESMVEAYRSADAVLSRSGALSCSEIAAAGLPAVLVPYPYATDDHQHWNALALVETGGAIIIEDSALDAASLAAELDPLFSDPARLEKMGRSLAAVARPDAAGRIADDIEALVASRDRGARRRNR